MTKYTITASYFTDTKAEFELPEGVTFDQIKDHYIKWFEFHYTLDGKAWHKVDIEDDCGEETDYKKPEGWRIRDEDYNDVADGGIYQVGHKVQILFGEEACKVATEDRGLSLEKIGEERYGLLNAAPADEAE